MSQSDPLDLIGFKTQYGFDFRRFSMPRYKIPEDVSEFRKMIQNFYKLENEYYFQLFYKKYRNGILMMINTDDDLMIAIQNAAMQNSLVRLTIVPKFKRQDDSVTKGVLKPELQQQSRQAAGTRRLFPNCFCRNFRKLGCF